MAVLSMMAIPHSLQQFACYLLLAARQMAKMEVMAKERRDQEKREEYKMWKANEY